MIGRIASRFIGPKVLLGLLLAASVAAGWFYWGKESAESDAAAAGARADKFEAALHRTAGELERVLQEKRRSERIVAAAEQEAEALREQARQTRSQLEEAKADAPDDVRACLDTRLPDPLADGLRVEPGRGAGGAGDATGAADE